MQSYSELQSFSRQEIDQCGQGQLFGVGRPKLPIGHMLMFDRITSITSDGGAFGQGEIFGELDVDPDMWFFKCHFVDDPVMPGCLGLDALWQLLGFYLGWLGHPGKGRALGVGEVKFSGQVVPTTIKIAYKLSLKRVIARGSMVMGLADGFLYADEAKIYSAQDLRVGIFPDSLASN